jgi:tripartite-type tricarboxylate transporter receptor subunit TctC
MSRQPTTEPRPRLRTTTRRGLLAGAIAAGTIHKASATAAWPDRPLRLVVPFPSGSGPDLLARVLAPHLQAGLGQVVVVDNRPGAGGTIGTQIIAQATDGHTIGLSVGGPATTARVFDPRLPYNPIADLAPVSLLARLPYLLVASRALSADSVGDFTRGARRMAEGLAAGSIGAGTVSHLLMAEVAARHGFGWVHVPYRGYPQLLQDLVPGRLDAAFVAASHVLPLLPERQVVALATTGPARMPTAPGIPTLIEAGEHSPPSEAWIGLFAPATIPVGRIAQLAHLARQALGASPTQEMLAAAGFAAGGDGPDAFAELRAAEASRWGALIRQLGLSAAS